MVTEDESVVPFRVPLCNAMFWYDTSNDATPSVSPDWTVKGTDAAVYQLEIVVKPKLMFSTVKALSRPGQLTGITELEAVAVTLTLVVAWVMMEVKSKLDKQVTVPQ